MKRKPRIGLLPLYLKLYDDTDPGLRNQFEPLIETVLNGLAAEGIESTRADICRIESEFHEAIHHFKIQDIDLIITLHLAYSLSLESINALASASCPILMLDTTLDYDFGPDVDPARIMYNHGIHGVQDLASMMRRRRIPFEIIAGHITESNIIKRAAAFARAAYGARSLRETKALRIGEAFQGMGDFTVDEPVLQQSLGVTVMTVMPDALTGDLEILSNNEVEEEMRLDRERYLIEADETVHRRSVRLGLGLRRFLDSGGYTAFSANFLAFNSSKEPIDTVPFLEISKAMSRGIGYAGEGDVLTASLAGALERAFGRTTFTEAFCPDWKHGTLFLSHMGEINPNVSSEKPLLCEKEFPWTGAMNPAILAGAPAPGPAALINLAPGPDYTFRLIIAPVKVMEDTTNPALRRTVRGWIRPSLPLERFLEEYSRNGGTHHCALTLGNHIEALAAFASFLRIERIILSE